MNVPPTSTPRIATRVLCIAMPDPRLPLRLRRPDPRHRDRLARRLGAALPRARPRAAARAVGDARRHDRRLGPDGRTSRSSSASRSTATTLNERRYAHELSLIEAEELRPGIAEYLAAARPPRAEARDRLELVAPLDRHAPRAARARRSAGTRSSPPTATRTRAKPRPTLYLEALELLGVSAGRGGRLRGLAERRPRARRPPASSASPSRTRSRASSGSTAGADLVLDSLADLPPGRAARGRRPAAGCRT